jgi:hypothetical protein
MKITMKLYLKSSTIWLEQSIKSEVLRSMQCAAYTLQLSIQVVFKI